VPAPSLLAASIAFPAALPNGAGVTGCSRRAYPEAMTAYRCRDLSPLDADRALASLRPAPRHAAPKKRVDPKPK